MSSVDKTVSGLERHSPQRRQSHRWEASVATGAIYPSDSMPTSLDAHKGPPISYRDPYDARGTRRSNSTGHPRSFSARAQVMQNQRVQATKLHEPRRSLSVDDKQIPPKQANVVAEQDQKGSLHLGNECASPISYLNSPNKESETDDSQLRNPNMRTMSVRTRQLERKREWAPDRSPLQKLEVTLGDISKEEKRARVAEAEMILKQSKVGRDGLKANEEQTPNTGHRREPSRHVSRSERTNTKTSVDVQPRSTGKGDQHRPTMSTSQANDVSSSASNGHWRVTSLDGALQSSERKPLDARYDQGISNSQVQNGPTYHEKSEGGPLWWEYDSRQEIPVGLDYRPDITEANKNNIRTVSPATDFKDAQHGYLSEAVDTNARMGTVSAPNNGHRLRRDPSRMRASTGNKGWSLRVLKEKQELQGYRSPDLSSPNAYDAGVDSLEKDDEQMRPEVVQHAQMPTSTTITSLDGQTRKKTTISIKDPRPMAPHLDEWKRAGVAKLLGEDLDLNDPTHNKAWLEGEDLSLQGVDRGSKGDGMPASFNPPLFLKCGPLLRYTGLRKDNITKTNRRGESITTEREIWRGTVMIVTSDTRSSYEKVPTLRLFKQPMHLLPPPPDRVDAQGGQQLPSEYVDPIAGLPKITRTGGSVYVKPVDKIQEGIDLSMLENEDGLFEDKPSQIEERVREGSPINLNAKFPYVNSRLHGPDGEFLGKYTEVKGFRLHAERGLTFWRFNLEVELGVDETRIAYRINNGPAIGFWVPARGQGMNIMFYSCNGFSLAVERNQFCGPDPLWRDVLNQHQTRPFHVMLGGGDQIYNDAITFKSEELKSWLAMKNPIDKHKAPFSPKMQDELENIYLERYCMWFSQGLFSIANSQIPMVNMWDDHDIIDGFGSYPHHFMRAPVFSGLGAAAFKYYILFQHQSVPEETQANEPSWCLSVDRGPYINEFSRHVFMFLGNKIAFLGLDCRTERMKDEVLSENTYDIILDRLDREIVKGETKHLIVLLSVPIAYPRLVWLESLLTSKAMNPIKAMSRAGLIGRGVLNKFDGGVELLDDLDDHWTAKDHKEERGWFIEELQELAAEKSVRITILGGDVHMAAVGQFYSNPKLNIPKDKDHRYIPNVISSAIANTPPPEMLADVLNKRNKVHHLNSHTDESMIPMFNHDTDGKRRNNKHLLPRRNWCSIRAYQPGSTPPPTPPPKPFVPAELPKPKKLQRSLSISSQSSSKSIGLLRRLSLNRSKSTRGPPPSAYDAAVARGAWRPGSSRSSLPQTNTPLFSPRQSEDSIRATSADGIRRRPGSIMRRPTNFGQKAAKKGGRRDDDVEIDLADGLDVTLNCEVDKRDPAGITVPYRLLVPALWYDAGPPPTPEPKKSGAGFFKFPIHRAKGAKDDQSEQQGDERSSDDQDSKGEESIEREQQGPVEGVQSPVGYGGIEAYKEKKTRRWF